MIKPKIKKFGSAQDGAVAVEFAIVSLLFLVIVFGIIEFARLGWVKQVVTDVAFRSARCATAGDGDNAVSCGNAAAVNMFAVNEAANVGIILLPEQISADLAVMCNGYLANQVRIRFEFQSPVVGLIPGLQQDVSVLACYPVTI